MSRVNRTACPALIDLFREPRTATVEAHLEDCPRCQALLGNQEERLREEPEPEEQSEPSRAWDAAPGSIALISAPESDEYLVAVVAKHGDDAVTVVPVSEQIELATEWDMLIDRDVLGYEAFAEIWNFGSVLPEQLVDTIAELPASSWPQLQTLLRAAAAGGERSADVRVGPMVLASADPRLVFQDEEGERLRVYWEPTLALAGAATLGQLVLHRREELGVSAEELEEVAPSRGWLQDLERDALDIPRVLKAPTLAALMKRLRIGASQRLGRIAALTIEAAERQTGYASGTAYGRRRRGYPGRAAAEQSVPEYVSEFLSELEKS